MSKYRRQKRSNIEKAILFILFLILIGLLIYAFKDNFIKDDKNINKKTTTKIQEKKNKIDKNSSDDTKKEEEKKETKKDESNPKSDEKSETKQQLEDNVTVNIELIGKDEITLKVGEKYKEYGVKAIDSNGKDVSNKVSVENNVDTSKQGEYMVIYSIGKSMVIRNVTVK